MSYRSMDCNNKLLKELFSDSKIARGIHCGRTKLEAIATNILGPLSIKTHLKKINKKCFSISSDASNKGNIKLFPIGVQYFDTNEGIVNFDLTQISNMFLLDINLDKLFDETNTFNTVLNSLKSDDKQLDNTSKYWKILSNGDFNNLSAVIGTVMAIPVGNDFVERVFSSLHRIWSDSRNRLSVETIKAEIFIKHNFNMDCFQLKKLVINDKNLLKSVKSSVKYN